MNSKYNLKFLTIKTYFSNFSIIIFTNQISKVGFTYQLWIDSGDFSLEIELISHQKETKVHLQNELWKFYLCLMLCYGYCIHQNNKSLLLLENIKLDQIIFCYLLSLHTYFKLLLFLFSFRMRFEFWIIYTN